MRRWKYVVSTVAALSCIALLGACSDRSNWMGEQRRTVSIIPLPQNVSYGDEVFDLSGATAIVATDAALSTARQLQAYIEHATGVKLPISNVGSSNVIRLEIDKESSAGLGDEGYELDIGSSSVSIRAPSEAGLFYGWQSLRQLLPVVYEEQSGQAALPTKLPGLRIVDSPRFSWRGFMLDEARHFQGMEAVKRILDQMARLKMNRFHWHLTDHQGWRIEIQKYPKLTEIGGYRKDTEIGEPFGWGSGKFAGKPHSGFYTQNQVREIIEYAAARHIEVIPEIEMPGHSAAAIAAYPWLGFTEDPIEVPATNGIHPFVFNIADPRFSTFIRDVLTEVMALFPSKVIHIGGDEVVFDHWKNSSEIDALMQEKALSSFADLQVEFTNEISVFLRNNGRRMMGWNDILGTNLHNWQDDPEAEPVQSLDENALVHFWKGDLDLVRSAADKGHQIVNAIHENTYLDYPYHAISLKKAYEYDPVPEELEEEFRDKIIGTSSQMWTEFVPDTETLEGMVFPRLAAYAEVAWTAPEQKNYGQFRARMTLLVARWTIDGVAYNQGALEDSWYREFRVGIYSALFGFLG